MTNAAEGRRIAGRYRLRGELGSGAHGKVYLAVDLVIGGEVAVKLSCGDSGAESLRREFEVLGRLRHPNLPRATDYGRLAAEGETYLALEYMDGVSLDALDALGETDLADLLIQACRGLGFLHRHGIVHGDVKPSNLLVVRRPGGGWWLRLIDLGLSLSAGEGRRGVLRGTARYAAPSVLRGEPPGPRSDLYSLGACFRPLAEERAGRAGRSVEGILRRLLAADGDARYQSAERVVEDLLRVVPALREREDGAFLVGAPLVGRAEPVARLEAWLAGLGTDRAPALLTIRGEGGTGKTRFLDELEHRALLRGHLVCRTSCPSGPPSPFEPLRRVLHHLGTIRAQDDPATSRELGLLATRLGGGGAPPADEVGTATLHLALRRGLEAAARGRRVLVLVDDGQWLDASTAAFLRLLHQAPRSPGFAFAVASRSPVGEKEPGAATALGRGARIALGPLGAKDAAALAAAILGPAEDVEPVARNLAAAAEGNPGFVEEAARTWTATHRAAGGAGAGGAARAWTPPSLRALHERRWKAMARDERLLAGELSVLDRPVPWALVEALTSLPAAEVAGVADRLEARGVLCRETVGGAPGVRFVGDSLRRFVLDRLDDREARARHLAAAEAWTRVQEDPRERSEVLAHHFLSAGRIEEGAAHGVLAARRYVARRLHLEAIALCERILGTAGSETWEADLRESLGDACHGVGRFRRARAAYERAGALLETAPPGTRGTGREVRLLRKRGTTELSLGRFPEARALLTEALGRVDGGTEVEEQARVREHLAHVAYRLGDVEGAKAHLRAGLGLFPGPRDEPATSDLWNDLGIIEFQQGRYDRSLAHHRRALEIRERAGDLDGQSRSLTNLANVALVTGDVEEASRNYEASLEIKRRLGNAQSIAVTLHNLALLDHRMGRFGAAIAHLEETVRRQREIADVTGRIRTLSSLARVWLDKGELERSARLAGAAVRLARRKGHREGILAAALATAGMVDVVRGERESARARIEEGLAIATGEGLLPYEGELRTLAAEALLLAGGDPGPAAEEARRGIAIARRVGDVQALAHGLLVEGELALDEGREAVAAERAEEVLALVERSPAPLFRARAHLLQGRAARDGGRIEEAARALHEGLEEAEALEVPEIAWQGCAALAEFHAGQGRVRRAVSWIERCARVLEEIIGRIGDPVRQDAYLRAPRRARALSLLGAIASGKGAPGGG